MDQPLAEEEGKDCCSTPANDSPLLIGFFKLRLSASAVSTGPARAAGSWTGCSMEVKRKAADYSLQLQR